jgi:ABC-type uncharacterized transport system substrate-binding protein
MNRIFAFSARAHAPILSAAPLISRVPPRGAPVLRTARRTALAVPLALLTLTAAGPSARASEPIQTTSTDQVASVSASSGPRRIGFLSSGSTELLLEDFRQGLGELGYVEGQTIVIEERYADGRAERLPALAAELVGLPVDVIVTAGAPATQAAKHATGSIPVVAVASDPVGTGLVGGNVTGLAMGASGLPAKRLELLKSAFPWVSRVGYLANMGNAVTPLILREVQDTAQQIGVQIQTLEVRGPDDFDGAFDTGTNAQLDALIVLDDPMTFANRARIVDFAANNGLVAN